MNFAQVDEIFAGLDQNSVERVSRNANHHEEEGGRGDIFDRAVRAGIRVFDGKDREGADDLGNELNFLGHHQDHSKEVEKLRQLLNSGLSLGNLIYNSTNFY